MNRNDFIINEKASRDTIDVKRAYIMMAGDHAAGVLLSQIVFWHLPDSEGNPNKMRVEKNDEFWIAKKREDWWDEICMLPKQFDRAIKALEIRQLVKTEVFRFDGSPTKHVRLNWEVFLPVYEAIINNDKPSFDPEGGKWIFPDREYRNSLIGNIETPEQGISETSHKPTPAVAPTLVENGPEITTETTTEKNTPISNEIGAQTMFLEEERPEWKKSLENETPTLTVNNPGQGQENKELHYVRMVVKYFNTLHEQYPDKISKDVTVPRKSESLASNKYATVRQWYADGRSSVEVCEALSKWVAELTTTVGGLNYFSKKPFPSFPQKDSRRDKQKEYDATRRLIERLK